MTFITDNENFLKFGLGVSMKGLGDFEQKREYLVHFANDARKRVQAGYSKACDNVDTKIEFYTEVLKALSKYDLEYILLGIYFDEHSDQLLAHLSETIKLLLNKDVLRFGSLRSLFTETVSPYDGSIIKGFLKDFFIKKIELDLGEWEADGLNNNPVINKFNNYIISHITNKSSGYHEIQEVLLNFSKLWDIYYGKPFNNVKAIILIHKLSEQYNRINPTHLTINLGKVILDMNDLLNEIIPAVIQSPLSDIANKGFYKSHNKEDLSDSIRNYLSKNIQFQKRLEDDSVFFIDLGNFSWLRLINEYCNSNGNAALVYKNEILNRKDASMIPSALEISKFVDFVSNYTANGVDKREFIQKIIFENYIYYSK